MRERGPEAEYLVRHKGRTFGPYSRPKLEAAARDGQVTRHDDIRDADGRGWVPAWKVPWLRDSRGRRLLSPNAPTWILVVATLGLGGLAFWIWTFTQRPTAPPQEQPAAAQASSGSSFAPAVPVEDTPRPRGVDARLAARPEGEALGALPVRVHLSARGSYSVHGAIVRYDWDLDRDGLFEVTTTTPDAPEIVELAEVGTHVFHVAVVDETGRRVEAQASVRVQGAQVTGATERVARLEALLAQERERKAWWLDRIARRHSHGIVDAAQDARDAATVEKTIDPVITRLEAEVKALQTRR